MVKRKSEIIIELNIYFQDNSKINIHFSFIIIIDQLVLNLYKYKTSQWLGNLFLQEEEEKGGGEGFVGIMTTF